MTVLVIAEHDNQSLVPATLNVVGAAKEIDSTIELLVAGCDCDEVVEQAKTIQNISKVLVADSLVYQNGLAENLALLIQDVASSYTHILAPATTFGKNVMPRASALLDLQQVSEISQVIDKDTFVRPIYAGNALATVKSNDEIKLITVRSTSFEAVEPTGGSADIQTLDFSTDTNLSTYLSGETDQSSDRPELTSANVVISGGRGMKSGENFALLDKLAEKLNAAVGASRAAVDAGFAPNDFQVGQTGKVVAPDLYIAVGISGAIQHLAGMKDSKVIVAINTDPDAPIFQVADYGLQADLFDVVPELTEAL